MSTRKFFASFACALLSCALLAGCAGQAPEPADAPRGDAPSQDRPVTVSLSSLTGPLVPGRETTLALHFRLAEGWHLYWDGQNDTGFPPSFEPELLDGWMEGPIDWPAPERYPMPGDMLDHVYHHELILYRTVTPPADLAVGGKVTIPVETAWLACKEACVPGDADLKVELPVVEAGRVTRPVLPARTRPLPPGRLVNRLQDDLLELTFSGARKLTFFPAADGRALVSPLEDGERDGEVLRLRLDEDPEGGTPLRGILSVTDGTGGVLAYTVDLPLN